jgi:hypothetical protein
MRPPFDPSPVCVIERKRESGVKLGVGRAKRETGVESENASKVDSSDG